MGWHNTVVVKTFNNRLPECIYSTRESEDHFYILLFLCTRGQAFDDASPHSPMGLSSRWQKCGQPPDYLVGLPYASICLSISSKARSEGEFLREQIHRTHLSWRVFPRNSSFLKFLRHDPFLLCRVNHIH